MRIGIDLGGSKIEGIALDDTGAVTAALRVPTPQHDYAATVAGIAHVVSVLEAETGVTATVGIGAPGSAGRDGRWQGANATWINTQPLEDDLAVALRREIRLANDANCFTVSEACDGAAAGARVVFGVIIGTGVGGGLVVDGKLIAGRHGIAGEWGHVTLPWARADEYPGRENFCGHRGTIETWVAAKALERDFVERGGGALSATSIADSSDPVAVAAFADYIDRLGRGLAMIVNIVDPDVIVLGGGASRIGALYDRLPEVIARYAFTEVCDTPVVRNRHGDASGVRGAAQLW